MKRLRFSRGLSICLASLLVCLTLTPALGLAEKSATAAYEASVQEAVSEYNAGRFEEAQAIFRRAHGISPNARTWRGLGICAFELRQYVEAIGELEAALVDPRKPLTPEQRTHTQQMLEQARGFVSVYHVRITPSAAHLVVDGKEAQLHGDTLHLDPGPHVIVVRAPGYQEQRTELRTGAGLQDDLRIELAIADRPEQGAASASSPGQAVPPPGTPVAHPRPWTWALAGTAVAGAVTAVGLFVGGNGLHDEYTDCVNEEGDNCPAVKQTGQNMLKGARITGALAGSFAVGALIAFFVEGRSDSNGRTSLLLGPDRIQLRHSF